MDPKLSLKILLVATIVFGLVIGLLGALDSGATGRVASVGGVVIGGLWAIRAILTDRRKRG